MEYFLVGFFFLVGFCPLEIFFYMGFFLMGFCPLGFCPLGFCSHGILSSGIFSSWDFVLLGFFPTTIQQSPDIFSKSFLLFILLFNELNINNIPIS